MRNSRGVTAGVAAALSAGLLLAAPASQASSTIDLPQPNGNTVQVSIGQGILAPQFTLWPIPNVGDHKTEANVAIDRGNNQPSGSGYLIGFGSGNVVQFATGGNIIAPQFAVGADNNLTTRTEGNFASGNGNGSVSEGRGLLIDGNGNVFQVAFLQGNIIAPQFALAGDNNADHTALGNGAFGNGNGSDMFSQDGFAFVTGNGNIIQIEILSDNVIAPQFVAFGDNTLMVVTDGNIAEGNGNQSSATTRNQQPFVGIFQVTGDGNVTHIAILSNNVWAPQIALPGSNHSDIFAGANHSEGNGNESTVDSDNHVEGSRPMLTAVRTTLNTLTGNTNRPVLDAIERTLPVNQHGTGNTQQNAAGSGSISNDQVAVTVAVETDTPFKAEPVVLAGDNDKKAATGSTTKKSWKPGDGIRKVVKAIKNAVKPKPKAEAAPE